MDTTGDGYNCCVRAMVVNLFDLQSRNPHKERIYFSNLLIDVLYGSIFSWGCKIEMLLNIFRIKQRCLVHKNNLCQRIKSVVSNSVTDVFMDILNITSIMILFKLILHFLLITKDIRSVNYSINMNSSWDTESRLANSIITFVYNFTFAL